MCTFRNHLPVLNVGQRCMASASPDTHDDFSNDLNEWADSDGCCCAWPGGTQKLATAMSSRCQPGLQSLLAPSTKRHSGTERSPHTSLCYPHTGTVHKPPPLKDSLSEPFRPREGKFTALAPETSATCSLATRKGCVLPQLPHACHLPQHPLAPGAHPHTPCPLLCLPLQGS